MAAGLRQRGVVLPAESLHKVGGRGYQGGFVVAYQVVAALRVFVARAAGEGHHVASVALGDARRDECAAVRGALHHYRSVGRAGHDAVAAQEVELVGVGMREEFGQQAAVGEHFARRVLMARRVEVVKSVGQHGHGVNAVGEGLAVRADVYAVSQSAHDEHVRAQLFQSYGQSAHAVLPVGGAPPRAHYADYAPPVKRAGAAEEQRERRVGAVFQPPGVSLVAHA